MEEHWLSFDLDGTLANHPFRYLVLPRLCGQFEGLAPEAVEQACRDELHARLARGNHMAAWNWDDVFAAVGRTLGRTTTLRVTDEVALALAESDEDTLEQMVYPDVVPALTGLKDAGFRLALATNGYARYQLPMAESLNLLRHMDLVLTPDTAGYAKPDPRILGALPGASVLAHVGDILSQDVLMAKRAGIAGVWIDRDPEPSGSLPERVEKKLRRERSDVPPGDVFPDHVIGTIGELLGVLGMAPWADPA